MLDEDCCKIKLLCLLQFTAGSQSWTRCPFTDARFQGVTFCHFNMLIILRLSFRYGTTVSLCVCVMKIWQILGSKLLGVTITVQSLAAWEVVATGRQGHEDVKMLSQIAAEFSVGLCERSKGSAVCQITETHTIHAVGIAPLLRIWGRAASCNNMPAAIARQLLPYLITVVQYRLTKQLKVITSLKWCFIGNAASTPAT